MIDLNLTFNLVSSSLSAVSTSIMIIVFSSQKGLRQVFAFRLIYYLTCSDFAGSILTIIQSVLVITKEGELQTYDEYCQAVGMLKIFFFLMSFLWTTSLCYCLVESLVNDRRNIEKYERSLFIIAFFVPLMASLVPIILKSYKLIAKEEMCWIKAADSVPQTNVLRITCFFGILWVLVLYNICSITRVGIFIRNHSADLPYLNRWKMFYFYPIIMAFCWFWPSVKQISDWITVDDSEQIPVILAFTHLFTPLSGLFNLLTFIGTNSYLRQRLREKCCLCLGKGKSSNESPASVDQKQSTTNLNLQKSMLQDVQNTGDLNYSANRMNSISQHFFSESI